MFANTSLDKRHYKSTAAGVSRSLPAAMDVVATVAEPAWTKEYEDFRALLTLVGKEMRIRGDMLETAVADPSSTRKQLTDLARLAAQFAKNAANIGTAARHLEAVSGNAPGVLFSDEAQSAWAAPFPGMSPEHNMSPEMHAALKAQAKHTQVPLPDQCTDEPVEPKTSAETKTKPYRELLRLVGTEFELRGLQLQQVANNQDATAEVLTDIGSMFGQLCESMSGIRGISSKVAVATGCQATVTEESKAMWRAAVPCVDEGKIMSDPLALALVDMELALKGPECIAPRGSGHAIGGISDLAMLVALMSAVRR